MILLWSLAFFPILASALEFELARDIGRFGDISDNANMEIEETLTYNGMLASGAFMLDPSYQLSGDYKPFQNYSVTFTISDHGIEDSLMSDLELSLSIIMLDLGNASPGSSSVEVEIGQDFNDTTIYSVTEEKTDPYSNFRTDQSLFRTWSQYNRGWRYTDPYSKFITIRMNQWYHTSAIYFSATLHQRMHDGIQECSDPYEPEFSCNPGSFDNRLCIPSELACNYLPDCASEVIPNRDEFEESTCLTWEWGLQAAIRVLVYTLTAVGLFLILIALIRFFYFRYRYRAQRDELDRRYFTRNLSGILTGSLPRRPPNAPPTYEDATKHDNPCFEGGDELPPSYSSAGFPEVPEQPPNGPSTPDQPVDPVESSADNGNDCTSVNFQISETSLETNEGDLNNNNDNNDDANGTGENSNNQISGTSDVNKSNINPEVQPSSPPPYDSQDRNAENSKSDPQSCDNSISEELDHRM